MKLSIVIAVLNSHEVVRRQIEHFNRMQDVFIQAELILVDDGSNPPLNLDNCELRNARMYYTNDKRPWTQGLARNLGASKAKSEFLLFTDIDHILTLSAINDALKFDGDKMVFPRYYGILDQSGDIISDQESMLKFGLHPMRVRTRRGFMCAGMHGNTYVIRKTIFDLIGGYDPRLCQSMFHVGGKFMSEERRFNNKYDNLIAAGKAKDPVIGSRIYCYPVGKFRVDGSNNPFGLFHDLSLEQTPQPMME